MRIARALKDLPGFRVGDTAEIDAAGGVEGRYSLNYATYYFPHALPGYFSVEMKQWKPKPDTKFWFVAANGEPDNYPYFSERNAYQAELAKLGNCFPTKELAEAAASSFRAALAKFHEENPYV